MGQQSAVDNKTSGRKARGYGRGDWPGVDRIWQSSGSRDAAKNGLFG